MPEKFRHLSDISKSIADTLSKHLIDTEACEECPKLIRKAVAAAYRMGMQDGIDEWAYADEDEDNE